MKYPKLMIFFVSEEFKNDVRLGSINDVAKLALGLTTSVIKLATERSTEYMLDYEVSNPNFNLNFVPKF
jgi:hypothetical protein